MKDPNLFLQIGVALVIFTAIAAYLPAGIRQLTRRSKARPPHRVLLTVVRVWFALLALGCVVLLVLPLLHR